MDSITQRDRTIRFRLCYVSVWSETQSVIDPGSVVAEQHVYLEDLMSDVKQALDSGTQNPDVLRKTVKLPKYEKWQYYEEWLPMNIERIWAFYHMGW